MVGKSICGHVGVCDSCKEGSKGSHTLQGLHRASVCQTEAVSFGMESSALSSLGAVFCGAVWGEPVLCFGVESESYFSVVRRGRGISREPAMCKVGAACAKGCAFLILVECIFV